MIIVFLTVLIINNQKNLEQYSSMNILKSYPEESAGFRNMYVTKELLSTFDNIKQLAAFMLDHNFQADNISNSRVKANVKKRTDEYLRYDEKSFNRICSFYESVLADLEYFPVAECNVTYENTWMFERNYGGVRGHEGTDIIPPQDRPGIYPVISMTDGIVENAGWLDKGGYRIGIRSPHGGYFYYAHLSSYMKDFEIGEEVKAGEPLGYMGNTGYGPEGTAGQFITHLHLGIYISTDHYSELSVNPYWILKCIEEQRIYYNF